MAAAHGVWQPEEGWQHSIGSGGNSGKRDAVKEVSDKTGVAFPPGTVVVNAIDGGGRDASYGFFLCALFSPVLITLPGLKGDPGTSGPLLEASVQVVRGAMAKRKVAEPEMALDGEWKKDGFAFSGTLIRTSQGDYLVIRQFRDREVNRSIAV